MRKNRRAASIIEYAVLIVMFLAAILLMQKSIARTFFGRWKDLGDSFGYGQQYDANTTLECGRFVNAVTNQERWYDQKCYDCCMDKPYGESTQSCPNWGTGECMNHSGSARRLCCAYRCQECTF